MTNTIILEIIPILSFAVGIILYSSDHDKRPIIAVGIALVVIYGLVSMLFWFQKRVKLLSTPALRIIALALIGVGFFGSISSFFSSDVLAFKLLSFSLFSQLLVRAIAEYKKLGQSTT